MDGVRFACCFRNETREEISEIYKKMKHLARHRLYVDGIRVAVSISGGAV